MSKRATLLGIASVTLAVILTFTIAAEKPDYTQSYGDVTFKFERNEDIVNVSGFNKKEEQIYFGSTTVKDSETAWAIQEELILDFLNAQVEVETLLSERPDLAKPQKPKTKVIKLGNSTRGEKKVLTREERVIKIFHQKALERFKNDRGVISVKEDFSPLPNGEEKVLRPHPTTTKVIGESLFEKTCGDPVKPLVGRLSKDADDCEKHYYGIHTLQWDLVDFATRGVFGEPLGGGTGHLTEKQASKFFRSTQRKIKEKMRDLKKLGPQCCQIPSFPGYKDIRKKASDLKMELESIDFDKVSTLAIPLEFKLKGEIPKPIGFRWEPVGVEGNYDVFKLNRLKKPPRLRDLPKPGDIGEGLE